MTDIQPATDLDIRVHALSLAARQMATMFESNNDSALAIATETLDMARQYRDWLADGDAEPGEVRHDDGLTLCAGCGNPIAPSEFQLAIEHGGVLAGACARAEEARRAGVNV